jgi:hypothetical protein
MGHINKILVKKLALSSFIGVVAGIVVLTYGKPLILKRPWYLYNSICLE